MGSSGLYIAPFTLSFTCFHMVSMEMGLGIQWKAKPALNFKYQSNHSSVKFIIVNSGKCYRGKEYGSMRAENKGIHDEQVAREGPHDRIMLELRLE